MTRKEKMIEAIKSIPLDPSYREIAGFPVPMGTKFYCKRVTGGSEENRTTEAGILLPETISKNTIIPHTAVVTAVGPEVPEEILAGMKIIYNPFGYSEEVMIKGVGYLLLDARTDIFGIVTPDTFVLSGTKDSNQVRREERIQQDRDYRKRKAIADQNEEDEQEQKFLKTIKKQPRKK